MSAVLKGIIKYATRKAKKAAAGGGKKPPGNGKRKASTTGDAKKAQERIQIFQEELQRLEKQVKAISRDTSKTPAQRVAAGKSKINKKLLLPRTEMKSGGKIMKKVTKKANGGRMSRVGLSPAEEARAGVLSEAARRRAMPVARPMPRRVPRAYRHGDRIVGQDGIIMGYKKGGQV